MVNRVYTEAGSRFPVPAPAEANGRHKWALYKFQVSTLRLSRVRGALQGIQQGALGSGSARFASPAAVPKGRPDGQG